MLGGVDEMHEHVIVFFYKSNSWFGESDTQERN